MKLRVLLFVALVGTGGCGLWDKLKGDDDDSTAASVPSTQFACRYEFRTSNCKEPLASEWASACNTVKTEQNCDEQTTNTTQIVGNCEFRLEYKDVEKLPGECGETDTVPKADTKSSGEPCSAHADCSSGLCQPRYYCTVGCKADAECASEFSHGCCVGEGSLGYCLRQKDCAAVCPEGASPSGLPTQCVCGPGFHLATDGSQCVKGAI